MTTTAKQPQAAPAPEPDQDLKTLRMEQVQSRLDSSPDGLTQDEAARRLTRYGPNEISEHRTNPLLKFLSYFWGPIPWMIEVAVVPSGAVRHWPDFFIILVLLIANAVVGYTEERQAETPSTRSRPSSPSTPGSGATARGPHPPPVSW